MTEHLEPRTAANPAPLAALILAAGRSSRMGRFKPLLPIGGKSAIEQIVGTFRAAGITRIGAVTGHEAEQLEPILHDIGITAVRNPDYTRGMFSSIQTGLDSLPAEVSACFLLPVDIPLVRPSTIEALVGRHRSGNASVTYPIFRGQRGHPPLIARRLFDEILAGNGEGGLCALLERHEHEAIDVDVINEGTLLDMDTPEDYARLLELEAHNNLPTVAECEAVLAARNVPDPVRRHSRAVAAVAGAISMRLGSRIDKDLVLAGSLLHDIAKGEPAHARVGASIVAGLGYPAVAAVVRKHMDLSFDNAVVDEAAVVFLADKLVREDRCVPLRSRFQPAFERFAEQPEALQCATRKYETALSVLDAIEHQAGAALPEILANCGVPT